MRAELDEQSKEAIIAYLKDDKTKLEYRYRFKEDNWTSYSSNVFCLDTYYYRIVKPKRKYRVGIVEGNPYIIYNETQSPWIENYSLFERWITDWVEYET